MRDSVRSAWFAFTEPLEGGIGCLYNDRRGIPTIAYGNAVFTPSEAAALPLMHPGGVPATPAEKIAAWHAVHDDPRAAEAGWTYAAKLSDLRLTREGMQTLALGKLDTNDRILLARLPEWESYNSCAQMGFHSLAWACGANCHFPRLFGDAANRDWDACAVEIYMNEWTPEGIHNVGIIPRNRANAILMRNAQRVDAFHLDPEYLNWQTELGPCRTHDDCIACPDLGMACTLSRMGANAVDTTPELGNPVSSVPPPMLPRLNTPIMSKYPHANPVHVETTSADGETIYPRPAEEDKG